jgi:lipoyl(octanoyl) transferase
MMPDLQVCHLGLVEHGAAYALQERVRAARQAGAIGDTVLVLEHPPVYTRGRRSDPSELPMGEAWYRDQGIDVVDVDRGGKVTYHGPGQLVAYPIVEVDDVIAFVRRLERAIVTALAEHGLSARSRADEGRDFTGVWIEERKIGSIGVHVSRGVTTHGLAVNVDNDLQPFEWIVPCGLGGVRMTSITRETGSGGHLTCFRKRLAHALARELGQRQRLVPPTRLERSLSPPAPAPRRPARPRPEPALPT